MIAQPQVYVTHCVRNEGVRNEGVRMLFDQSECGYGVRHGVYVRCLTNQSAAIVYVTGCTYAFRPIMTQYCNDRTASISMHSLNKYAQPQKKGLKTSYYTNSRLPS